MQNILTETESAFGAEKLRKERKLIGTVDTNYRIFPFPNSAV